MKPNAVRYMTHDAAVEVCTPDLSALRQVHDDAEVAWDRDCADLVIVPSKHPEIPDLRIVDARGARGTCQAWTGELGTCRLAIWHDELRCWLPQRWEHK